MAEVIVERVVTCASEAAALWPLVTDTERMNRAVGLSPAAAKPNDDATSARFVVSTVSGGFPLEYEERPFEWTEPSRFGVRRIVRRGLMRFIDTSYELSPRDGGGTDVKIRISVDPKISLISPVARLQVSRFVAKIAHEIREIDAALQRGADARPKVGHGEMNQDELARLSTAYLAALSGAEREAGERLARTLLDAPDVEVDRIRPFELADSWGLERNAVLGACLHAVGAGLLELTWDLVCPSCRTATERMKTLTELGAHAHCQLCDISYDLDLDRAVEATFRPPPALRQVDEGPYCIGGPARTPHVLAQSILPAGGETALVAPSRPGRYRVFVRGGPAAILRVVDTGAAEVRFHADEGTLDPPQADAKPGARLVVSQSLDRERHAKLERADWARAAATAHHVSMMPEFRRQFAREVLRPGLTLRISRVALLFTDLTGSTALYTRVGDAKAFRVVQDHFDLLLRIVSEHSGTLVKTIGDAVMAAFPSDEHAVRAGIDMLRAFPEFRRVQADAEELKLKVGVYAGPCYAVTANGVLDYFGQSVNVAARLQGAAGAGEIVLSAELADAARQTGWLDAQTPGRRFDAELKGLARPLAAERILVDG